MHQDVLEGWAVTRLGRPIASVVKHFVFIEVGYTVFPLQFFLPGSNLIKLFTAVIYKQARVFSLGKPFQPCLMFVGVFQRIHLSGALL
jgi:hypothetical protein